MKRPRAGLSACTMTEPEPVEAPMHTPAPAGTDEWREWSQREQRRLRFESERRLDDPDPRARLAACLRRRFTGSTLDVGDAEIEAVDALASVVRRSDVSERWAVALGIMLDVFRRLDMRGSLSPRHVVTCAQLIAGDAPWPAASDVAASLVAHAREGLEGLSLGTGRAVACELADQVEEQVWLQHVATLVWLSRDGHLPRPLRDQDPVADSGTNVAALARVTGRRNETISSIVERLVRAGVVERVRSKTCALRVRHGLSYKQLQIMAGSA